MGKEKIKKIHFNRSGTGGITPRVNLPARWIEEMGINEQENKVSLEFKEGKKRGLKITIRKHIEDDEYDF